MPRADNLTAEPRVLRAMRTLVRAGLVFAVVATVTAPVAAADLPAGRTDTVSPADQAAAVAYWTPERMRAAGADSNVPAERIAKPAAVPEGVGRFFFTEVPGVDSWCTATAVPSRNRDVVVTAAHCVHPGWTRTDVEIKATNVVFVPGYDQGKAPEGVFPARAYVVPDQYPLETRDLAMVVLATRNGKHVADAAGTQGIAFGTRPAGRATILGYPGSVVAKGESLLGCDVQVTFEQTTIGDRWDSPCDMAGGSSGGPWLSGFDGRHGTVFALVSRGGMDEDLHTTNLEGPAMGDVAKEVFQQAEAR